eukprot:1619804-Pyramimonas_sp.AAC.1
MAAHCTERNAALVAEKRDNVADLDCTAINLHGFGRGGLTVGKIEHLVQNAHELRRCSPRA